MKNIVAKVLKDQIDEICNKYKIINYTINADGTVDVDGDVMIQNTGLHELPLKFGIVKGNFNCSSNHLRSLSGCPSVVEGYFSFFENKITSLKIFPNAVGDGIYCQKNEITSLEGMPDMISGDFYCAKNRLKSLVGGPTVVSRNFICSGNELTTLIGGPITVGKNFSCYDNELATLDGCPTSVGGTFDCEYNRISTTYSGDVDMEINGEVFIELATLPLQLKYHIVHIKLILRYQRHFEIWNDDLSFNVENFQELIDEIEDGLE